MDVSGKKVTLVGMGKTSLALARLLKHLGAEPFVTECRFKNDCGSIVIEFETEGIHFEIGGHTIESIRDTTLIIPSPGVPPNIPLLKDALRSGITMISELEFAARYSTSNIIAVTGTNGKTTTTELITHLLRVCGIDVALAGNNENPFSSIVMQEKQPDNVVLEISSYQLELVETFRPNVAVVLNLSNDHLGRHSTMENYAKTKARIFRKQDVSDTAIINAEDPLVLAMKPKNAGNHLNFGWSPNTDVTLQGKDFVVNRGIIANRNDSPLPGKHNTENILAALAVMSTFDVDWSKVQEGLKTFCGVEHRIEKVTEIDNVPYYNDSKSTNLESLKVALESFEGRILLIAGGQGKGGDYSVLSNTIKSRVKHVIAIGADAEIIRAAWNSQAKISIAHTMKDAVEIANNESQFGDTVLLSPACASFDMYDNFEERGADFKQCIRDLLATEAKI